MSKGPIVPKRHGAPAPPCGPQELVTQLHQDWSQLDLAERGRRASQILALGISRRELARALNCSEGSIRRNEAIARLPDSQRAAIAQGHPAETFLAAKRHLLRVARQQEHLREEQATGRLSSDAAQLVVEWITSFGGLSRPYRVGVFEEARRILWSLEAIQERSPKAALRPPRSEAELAPSYILEQDWQNDDPIWIARLAESLAWLLFRRVTEPSIRDRALILAERLCDQADSAWQLRSAVELS